MNSPTDLKQEEVDSGSENPDKKQAAPPGPWWLSAIQYAATRSSGQWKRLFMRTLVVAAAFFLVLIAALFVGTRFFSMKIIGNQIYLGSGNPTLGNHVTVDAVNGLQNSHIYLLKGQRLLLEPEGRIHLAADQAYNFAHAAKPLIVSYTDRKWPAFIKRRYPKPKFDETSVFYRGWVGPEGESYESDILQDCKLRRDLNWGTILAVVLPVQVAATADPLEVLKAHGISVTEFIDIPGKKEIVAPRDGWLTFIVNDVVVSPYSSSQDGKDFYNALKRAAEDLSQHNRHRIPLQSLPLVFFSDNLGSFRITVTTE